MACPDSFWCIQAPDVLNALILVATIVAIYRGPLKAVELSRDNEDRRAKRQRQYDILHNLMKTRRAILSPDHVMSLNLIQIEFYDNSKILAAYKNYMSLLARPAPTITTPPQESQRFFRDQEDGLFDLLHAIAESLGFILDKRDLSKYSYAPQGWGTTETQLTTFRHLAIELLSGRRTLPVSNVNPANLNNPKFPPPPNPQG